MLASIGAFVLLGERRTGQGLAGLAVVVARIVLIASDGRFRPFAGAGGLRGVRWGGATGGRIASYTVTDGYAVRAVGVQPVILDWCSNALRFVMLLPVVARHPAKARTAMAGKWGLAVGVGLLSPLSYILVLGALRLGAPLSVVAPAREMSMMAGALMGMAFLGERVGRWRLAGCGLLIVGVALLAG